ncbi:MAG: hypothetical protein KJ630_16700 [Proteobacteria bacterium]|nr:hypothetical protein [Pseudomonadota bacterium]
MRKKFLSFFLGLFTLCLAMAALAADISPAYNKFLQIKVGDPAKDLLAQIGNPDETIDAFTYRVSNAFKNLELSTIYRFQLEGAPAEIIVGKKSGKIVRKQLSSMKCFPPIVVAKTNVPITPGVSLAEATAAVGAAPFLWIEFSLPVNATKPNEVPPVYQTYIWPDAAGQLAALCRDGKIIMAEYQPGGEGLLTAPPQAFDAVHPRIPRWLPPAPNNFSLVEGLEAYRQFLGIKLGIGQTDLAAALGKATSISETKDRKDLTKITQRLYRYIYKNPTKTIASSYTYYFNPVAGQDSLGPDGGVLTKKIISAMNVENKMLPRYIGQGLRGMTMAQLETAFGGKGRVHEVLLEANGKQMVIYGWGGIGAFLGMGFPEGSKVATAPNSGTTGSKEERDSRYEEYVIQRL